MKQNLDIEPNAIFFPCTESLWLLLDPVLKHQRFAENFCVEEHGKKQPSHQTP